MAKEEYDTERMGKLLHGIFSISDSYDPKVWQELAREVINVTLTCRLGPVCPDHDFEECSCCIFTCSDE